jgi:hypothetical protein
MATDMNDGGAGNFSPNFQQPVPPKKSSGLKTVLIVLGIFGGLGLLCCGGFVAMGVWGVGQAKTALAGQVRSMVETNPDFMSEIGTVQSFETNLMASGQESQKGNAGAIVFDVVGSNGKGRLIVQQEPGGQEMQSIILRTENGNEIDLISTELEVSAPPSSGN